MVLACCGPVRIASAAPPAPLPTPHLQASPSPSAVPEASPSPLVAPPDPVLLPFPAPTPAQAPLTLTIEEALTIALRNSPDLMSSRDQVRLAQYQVRSQYVPYNPTFSLFAQNLRVQNAVPVELFRYGVVQNQYTFYGTIQQLVYDFGRVHWSALAARLTEKQARQNYRTTLETLLQSVETTFLQALLADVNVEIAQQRVEERRSALKTASDLYRAGFVAAFDVLQYKSQLGQALQAVLTAKGTAEKAHEALVIAMGLSPGTTLILTAPAQPSPPPDEGRAGLEQALVKRPEVAALTWAVQSAQAQVRAATRASAPTVNLQAQYQGTNPYLGGAFVASQFNIIGSLNIPVLDGRLSHWEKMQALATVSATEHQLASMRRKVEQDVIQAFTDLETYWQLIELARQTSAQARDAYNIATVRYREGFSNSIELLNAQDTYVQANQNEATAEYNYRVALVNWRRAISGEYPVPVPESVKVEWEQPSPMLTPPTLPVAPLPSEPPTPLPPVKPSPSPTPRAATPSPQGAAR